MLWPVLLFAALADAQAFVSRPRTWHEFNLRVRKLTRAIMLDDTREIFRMFVPPFQDEISFARFDSAFQSWRGGRRAAIGQGRVVDTRGVSGQASTYIVFAGEDDYEYSYQSWIYMDRTWQLTWLSNILDQSFSYGERDTLELRAIRAAALDWLVAGEGLSEIRPGYSRPDTILLIDPSGQTDWLPDYPTVLCTPAQFRTGTGLPRVPFAFRFALTRNFGSVALCAVDIVPPRQRRRGSPDRQRSIQVFLVPDGDDWQYLTTGAIW